jgi:hypothetical protein
MPLLDEASIAYLHIPTASLVAIYLFLMQLEFTLLVWYIMAFDYLLICSHNLFCTVFVARDCRLSFANLTSHRRPAEVGLARKKFFNAGLPARYMEECRPKTLSLCGTPKYRFNEVRSRSEQEQQQIKQTQRNQTNRTFVGLYQDHGLI